jgi:hypothetical protein
MDHLRITSETLMYQGVIRVILMIRRFRVFFNYRLNTVVIITVRVAEAIKLNANCTTH